MKYKGLYQRIFEIIIIIIVATALGMFSGGATIFTMLFENEKCEECNCNVEDSANEIVRVYQEIMKSFYGDVDDKELKEIAINAMLSSLGDPNTRYMDIETSNDFNEKMLGEYKGVGLQIYNGEKGITVMSVFAGSPAQTLGMQIDDVIISVQGQPVTELSATEASILIKYGTPDTIKMEILRDEEVIEYTVEKQTVIIDSVTNKIFRKQNKNIGYISLSVFASNSFEQFSYSLQQLENEGIDGLIIDIRDNTGGYLHSVTDILDLFLEKDEVLYQLKTKKETEITKASDDEHRDYPIVILTNSNSASASEILAGALRESYGAYTVGTITYGKGTVQETVQFDDGSIVKITTKEWLTPNGNTINGVGISVDYLEELIGNYGDDTDNQLQKAIDVIIEMID